VKSRTLLRLRKWLLLSVAGMPLFQFFSGCYPNIPGIPNIPGAINLELQNLINRVIIESLGVIVANLLDL